MRDGREGEEEEEVRLFCALAARSMFVQYLRQLAAGWKFRYSVVVRVTRGGRG